MFLMTFCCVSPFHSRSHKLDEIERAQECTATQCGCTSQHLLMMLSDMLGETPREYHQLCESFDMFCLFEWERGFS